MAIALTPEEKARLEKENSLIRELPGSTGAEKGNYHNPVTGQEIISPVDPYHMTRRLRQGWRLGPAPSELRAKWVIREQELKEEDDRRQEEFENSDEHKVDLNAQAETFNDAVATAVTQVLEKLGHAQAPQAKEEASEVETNTPEQLNFFKAVDAPTESETKLNVSPASRPELKLVE